MFQDFLMENMWAEYFKHKHEQEEQEKLAKAKPVCCTYHPCVTGVHSVSYYTRDEILSGKWANQTVSPSGIKYTPRDDDDVVSIGFDGDRFGN